MSVLMHSSKEEFIDTIDDSFIDEKSKEHYIKYFRLPKNLQHL